jgi:alpha-ketoglutarate-dependent 2,4-dichlorophenoxyacetate dioxygenase
VIDMSLVLKPKSQDFVAEAIGVDLRAPLSPELVAGIEAAMDRYAVLILPAQDLDDDQQVTFAKLFGQLEADPTQVAVDQRRLTHADLTDVSNLDAQGGILAVDNRRRLANLGNRLWHSDSSFKRIPAKYSFLHARIVAPEGGETEFADMRAAWDALPEKTKAKLLNLVCEHSLLFSRRQLGFSDFTDAERAKHAPVRQRLVRRHAGSGRMVLYLSAHIGGIVGLPVPESLALIRDLAEHATQSRFVYRHSWRPHDLVIWDNRCTMHRVRAFEDQEHPRDMRRVTLQDSAPTLEQPT